MKRASIGALALGALIAAAAPAAAHVTVQPNEGIAGAFSRFVVRVPNERPDAGTVKIEVRFPALAFVSFEPKDGWERKVENVQLDEPIEAFGQEIEEAAGSVTWSGGRIGPNEFDEFGFSARMPEQEDSLVFEAIQTYDSGEVVRWVGEADAEEPAALVSVHDLGLEEGQGEIGLLAELQDQVGASGDGETPTGDDEEDDDDLEESQAGLWLGGAGLAIALVALVLALRPRRG